MSNVRSNQTGHTTKGITKFTDKGFRLDQKDGGRERWLTRRRWLDSYSNRGHLGYCRIGAADTRFAPFCLLAVSRSD